MASASESRLITTVSSKASTAVGISTYARGKMIAHPPPSILQAIGTKGVDTIIIPAIRMIAKAKENQKRLRIFGTSLKKLERSTSFFVAPQVMLYEKRWARMAILSGIARPPKKKKL